MTSGARGGRLAPVGRAVVDRRMPGTWRRKALLGVGTPVAGVVLYLLAWPVPIDPAAWTPPEPPHLAPNDRLAGVEWIGRGVGRGPESVAVDAQGRLYTGVEGGKIQRIELDGAIATFADTGGRPLGLTFDAAGHLIVADAKKGLLSVDPSGRVTTLAAGHQGRPFRFVDDVTIAPDGTIYFSDASTRFGVEKYKLDLFEHRPNGRVLAYVPSTGEVRLVVDRVHFANGVAVSAAGDYLLVNETGKYRILRHWLAGPKQGTTEPLVENLPGFPDNLTLSPRGFFWVALASPRRRDVDALLPRPFWRKVVARLPDALQPAPTRHAIVLAIDGEGRILEDLQDRSPRSFSPVTSVREHRGKLYFGSIERDAIGVIAAP